MAARMARAQQAQNKLQALRSQSEQHQELVSRVSVYRKAEMMKLAPTRRSARPSGRVSAPPVMRRQIGPRIVHHPPQERPASEEGVSPAVSEPTSGADGRAARDRRREPLISRERPSRVGSAWGRPPPRAAEDAKRTVQHKQAARRRAVARPREMPVAARREAAPRSMRERRGLVLTAELRRLDASEVEIAACRADPDALVTLLMRTLALEAKQPDAKQLVLLRRGENVEVSTVPKVRRLLARRPAEDHDESSVWSPGMKDWMSLERFRQLLGLAAAAATDEGRGVGGQHGYDDTEEEEEEWEENEDEEDFGTFPMPGIDASGGAGEVSPGMNRSRAAKAATAKAEVENMRAELGAKPLLVSATFLPPLWAHFRCGIRHSAGRGGVHEHAIAA